MRTNLNPSKPRISHQKKQCSVTILPTFLCVLRDLPTKVRTNLNPNKPRIPQQLSVTILPTFLVSTRDLPTKVKTNLKFTHLQVKDALVAFGKLHPALIGTDLVDGLYNQRSLSLRILLSHYRRCTSPDVWATAKRTYKGAGDLAPVEDIIKKLVDTDDFEHALVPYTSADSDNWDSLQASAPRHALWEVNAG